MRPDDIRKLYNEEEPATEKEAAATMHEVANDPDAARKLLLTLYSLAGQGDDAFDHLLHLVLDAALMELLMREMIEDDAFAIAMGKLITSVADDKGQGQAMAAAQAREMIKEFFAQAKRDSRVAKLLPIVLRTGLMQLVVRAVERDDDFALRTGAMITEGMRELGTSPKTPRGKPKKASMA